MSFDYEGATWGAERVRPGDRSFAGFRIAEVLARLPATGRVLEVGCGVGRFVCALREARPDLSWVGADTSRAALARLAERAPGLETRLVESNDLPADDGEFAAVLMLDVLEHLAEPEASLREVHRVLAPGGLLHLHVPCEGDPRSIWRWLPGQAGERALKRRFAGHIQRFRRGQVLSLLAASGFETLRVRNSLHLLGNLADLAAFLRLSWVNRSGGAPTTTGDLLAGGGGLVRLVDALLWCEARLLARVPSWSLHVCARRSIAAVPAASAARHGTALPS